LIVFSIEKSGLQFSPVMVAGSFENRVLHPALVRAHWGQHPTEYEGSFTHHMVRRRGRSRDLMALAR
jgi:hypothetical protein